MKQTRVVASIVIVGLIVGGAWWWRHRGQIAETPASAVSVGGSATLRAGVPVAYQESAHAIVTVTDAKGPVADAVVRIAHTGGEVIVVKTGADGIARGELAPGTWTFGASAADHEPAASPSREVHAAETVQIAIRLPVGGRTLAGIVTDTSGGPIVGARIDAARIAGARPSEAVASTMTGTDGRYKLSVAAGQLLVAASHTDYAPQSRYVEVNATGATADFKLVPGGVIEGIVRDEQTRQPVGGATVDARRDAPAMLLGEVAHRHATAGADGRFRITGLRPGSFALEAQAQSRYSHSPTIVGLGVAEQRSDVEILVGKGAAIHGITVDETGAPVAGIEVSTFGNDRNATTDERSNAKGEFVLDGLAPGSYQLMGTGADYVASGATPVELAAKDVEGVCVRVRRGGHVKGHVEPRQICEVRLDFDEAMLGPKEMPMLVTSQTTGPDGEFTIGPATPIAYVLAARCPTAIEGTEPVHVSPTMADVVLNVTPGASIAGRVVDGSGNPVAAATVMAAAQTGSELVEVVNGRVINNAQALTAADGTYELRGLIAATYRMHVLDRGLPVPIKTGTTTKVVLGATDQKTGVELAIDRADGVIRGTVAGPDGNPLADAWVSVQRGIDDLLGSLDHSDDSQASRRVTIRTGDDGDGDDSIAPVLTDAAGHFEIDGLMRAPWTVIAEAQAGKLRGRASKVTPDAAITIQLAGVSQLAGTVHVTGATPAWFAVSIDGPTRAESTFTWQNGAFSFGRVDPGTYTVHVTSSAGNADTTAQVVVGQSATVDLTLAPNAIVIGRVTDPSGKPLEGVPMGAIPDPGGDRIQISLSGSVPMSQADGSFRIETKAGIVAIVALGPHPTSKRGILAEAGKTVDIGTLVVKAPQ